MIPESLPIAEEFTVLFPGVWRWSAYSSHHKVELTSHAVNTAAGVVLIDPIPMEEVLRCRFESTTAPKAVIVTNTNHLRASTHWLDPKKIYAASSDFTHEHGLQFTEPTSSTLFGLTMIPIAGGPVGEIALFDPDRNLFIMGDALVNLPNRGLEILPTKYCSDEKLLRKSLTLLLAFDFDILLCAHGSPIVTGAKTRLQELLA